MASVGQISEDEFDNLSLFEAYDREHAGMIQAGIATRWPEEIEAEESGISDLVDSIMRRRLDGPSKG